MNSFSEDSRMKTARKGLRLAWTFFSVYLAAILLTSYLLDVSPLLWGLPLWVAVGNLIVPATFVLLLILVVEKGIPDIPLDDPEKGTDSVPLEKADDKEEVV